MAQPQRVYTDVIEGPLWDSATVQPGVIATLFMVPVGEGASIFTSGPKVAVDTNMNLAGQLPAGYRFHLSSVECEPVLGTDRWLLEAVALRFIVSGVQFVDIPASRATCRLTVEEVARGLMLPGMKWEHSIARKPLDLEPTRAWQMQAASWASRAVSIRVSLNGYLYRPVY